MHSFLYMYLALQQISQHVRSCCLSLQRAVHLFAQFFVYAHTAHMIRRSIQMFHQPSCFTHVPCQKTSEVGFIPHCSATKTGYRVLNINTASMYMLKRYAVMETEQTVWVHKKYTSLFSVPWQTRFSHSAAKMGSSTCK